MLGHGIEWKLIWCHMDGLDDGMMLVELDIMSSMHFLLPYFILSNLIK